MSEVRLARKAIRDLRSIGPGPERDRIRSALSRLGSDAASLDIKPVVGSPPWLRLRVGDYRVLYRPSDDGFEVERIVHRRDLERAVGTLNR